VIGFIWICALGLRADPLPIEWTHLIGMASLNTEKLEQVLFEKGRSCGSPSKGKLTETTLPDLAKAAFKPAAQS
jgi:hypothetical protein